MIKKGIWRTFWELIEEISSVKERFLTRLYRSFKPVHHPSCFPSFSQLVLHGEKVWRMISLKERRAADYFNVHECGSGKWRKGRQAWKRARRAFLSVQGSSLFEEPWISGWCELRFSSPFRQLKKKQRKKKKMEEKRKGVKENVTTFDVPLLIRPLIRSKKKRRWAKVSVDETLSTWIFC